MKERLPVSTNPHYGAVTIIGFGLIGSSIARGAKEYRLAGRIICADASQDVCDTVKRLEIADEATTDLGAAVENADLVLLCVPVGAMREVGAAIAPHLKPGAVVSDVGSVKSAVISDLKAVLPANVHIIPGHPIAGTEHSGPESGFPTLFKGRWCILTPDSNVPVQETGKLKKFWEALGSNMAVMDAGHHDRTLAITSHLPHLIAYTIVGTATDLEDHLKSEVIKFSASGFRDFTRIAASDPIMWRDIFLNNRDAVLDILQRFTEDLTAMQRAIRKGDGPMLQDVFTRTRAIRRGIIDAKQAS